ncbi:MAG: hypothetical protein HY399_03465 [Elusimicrobia bacterium]|nr:hypothetical protein [Elusimicrobiota bacterium]
MSKKWTGWLGLLLVLTVAYRASTQPSDEKAKSQPILTTEQIQQLSTLTPHAREVAQQMVKNGTPYQMKRAYVIIETMERHGLHWIVGQGPAHLLYQREKEVQGGSVLTKAVTFSPEQSRALYRVFNKLHVEQELRVIIEKIRPLLEKNPHLFQKGIIDKI